MSYLAVCANAVRPAIFGSAMKDYRYALHFGDDVWILVVIDDYGNVLRILRG
jgi:hypothetical protein